MNRSMCTLLPQASLFGVPVHEGEGDALLRVEDRRVQERPGHPRLLRGRHDPVGAVRGDDEDPVVLRDVHDELRAAHRGAEVPGVPVVAQADVGLGHRHLVHRVEGLHLGAPGVLLPVLLDEPVAATRSRSS